VSYYQDVHTGSDESGRPVNRILRRPDRRGTPQAPRRILAGVRVLIAFWMSLTVIQPLEPVVLVHDQELLTLC
jgi:hypothetical protein